MDSEILFDLTIIAVLGIVWVVLVIIHKPARKRLTDAQKTEHARRRCAIHGHAFRPSDPSGIYYVTEKCLDCGLVRPRSRS